MSQHSISPKIGKILFKSFVIIGLLFSMSMGYQMYLQYQYNKNIDAYFNLADQSSTLEKKEMYLMQYSEALKKAGLNEGDSRYFFKTPYTDLKTQYELVETLLTRLKETQKLDPKSFEYQKAIEQITEQEFGGFDTSTFYDGWIRQNVIRYVFSSLFEIFIFPFFLAIFIVIAFVASKQKKSS